MTSVATVRARMARRPALLSCSLAVLLLALATLGVLNPGGSVAVSVLFDHPFLFGVAALALLGVACRVAQGLPTIVRASGLTVAVVAALIWAALGGLISMFVFGAPHDQIASERSTAGSLEFRVIEGAAVIDPVWILRVRHSAGLLTREWSAGCLNGDDPADSFVKVKWIGPERVAVTVEDGRVLNVDLDPATGRPARSVSTGVGC